MTKADLIQKLMDAQDLLSSVYHFASKHDLEELEDKMSMADTMIVEAFDVLEEIDGLE
ncbi:MAG: hypothetical protein ACO29P_09665 [Bacteroidia bacterium]